MRGGAAAGQVRRLLGTPAARLATCLLVASGLLLALSLATHYAAYRTEVARPGSPEAAAWMSVLRLFDVNGEGNLPAWFSSALLLGGALLAAVLSVLVRRAGGRDAGWWAGLAALLSLLSLDEAASLHERLGDPAAGVLGDAARGPLRFAWIVPGALLALVVGVAFAGFVARLPAATRRLMVTAAALYLTGAVGLEAAGGVVLDADVSHAVYLLVSAAEEGLEMAGSVLLLYALLRLLRLRPEPDGGYHLAVDLQRVGLHSSRADPPRPRSGSLYSGTCRPATAGLYGVPGRRGKRQACGNQHRSRSRCWSPGTTRWSAFLEPATSCSS